MSAPETPTTPPERVSGACELEAYLDAPVIARFLRQVAEGLRRGELALGAEETPLVLSVGDELLFELILRKDPGDVLVVEVSWRRVGDAAGEGLVITS
jgi:amphi-Trp domain-containing protein